MVSSPPLAKQPTSPELRERTEATLERVVRPLLAVDGGKVQISAWTDAGVVIRMHGSCSGCPGRPYTIARLVEPVLRTVLGPDADITFEPG